MADKDTKAPVFASTALALSMALGQAPVVNEAPKIADTPVTQSFNAASAKQSPAAEVLTPAETLRRTKLNERLLIRAQNNFEATTAPLGRNIYTQNIHQLQQHLKDKLAEQNGVRGLVLDPTTFDAGIALGMQPVDVARRMVLGEPPALTDMFRKDFTDGHIRGTTALAAEDVKVIEDYLKREQSYNFEQLGAYMNSGFMSPGGTIAASPSPTSHGIGDDFSGSCIVVPASDLGAHKRRSLSHDDSILYTNLHEEWHCRDPKILNANPATPPYNYLGEIKDLPDNDAVRADYARNNQLESFADVGATGDMIRRHGKGTEVLDKLISDHQHDNYEVRHYSLPSLRALRDEINKMGVENFRKLDDAQAEKLYHRVVDDNALTANRVKIIQDSESSNPLKWVPPVLVTRFIDEDVARAQTWQRNRTIDDIVGSVRGFIVDSGYSTRIATDLKKYDAAQLLQDRAFADGGKITPATLIKAYGDMKDDLRVKISEDPKHADLYEAQMAKLQSVLSDSVQKTDYTGANLKRGVKIEDVEPGLRPKAAAAPAATKAAS